VNGPRPKAFDTSYDRVKKSTKEERKIAKQLGGYAHRRSGGLPWSKHDATTACGDITTPDLHIEHKRVEASTRSIGVTRKWLAKVTVGARSRMKIPAMVLHYEGAQGHEEDWLMMPLEVAERLFAAMRED